MYQLGFDFQAVSSSFCFEQVGRGRVVGRPDQLLLLLGQSPAKYLTPSGCIQIRPSAISMWEKTSVGEFVELALHGLLNIGDDSGDVNQSGDAVVGSGTP